MQILDTFFLQTQTNKNKIMKKLFYCAMALAMVAMVGCNKDAEEVVVVSSDAPSVNGTWVNVDDPDYIIKISGDDFTATYPSKAYVYSDSDSEWISTDITATQKFENGKIVSVVGETSISFVYEYTSTLYYYDYNASKSLTQVVTSINQASQISYDKVNGYLIIDGGESAPRNSYEDADGYDYDDKNSGETIIMGGIYEKQ